MALTSDITLPPGGSREKSGEGRMFKVRGPDVSLPGRYRVRPTLREGEVSGIGRQPPGSMQLEVDFVKPNPLCATGFASALMEL